jgi:low affinity iron permease
MYPYPRSPFSLFAKWIAHAAGHPLAFVFAAVTISVWLISGPLFGFSDTWQLVINTGTAAVRGVATRKRREGLFVEPVDDSISLTLGARC